MKEYRSAVLGLLQYNVFNTVLTTKEDLLASVATIQVAIMKLREASFRIYKEDLSK